MYSIDTVKDTLRQALLEERSMLLEDVDYLHGLLDGEVDLQVDSMQAIGTSYTCRVDIWLFHMLAYGLDSSWCLSELWLWPSAVAPHA